MLKLRLARLARESGDTLIEVTFALAILGFVILSCSVLMTAAFRTGQTARERTQVAEVAQQQLEALHSFRDNHDWAQFKTGVPVVSFHMGLRNTGTGNEWVPVAGVLDTTTLGTTLTVPTSSLWIEAQNPGSDCAYDFLLQY